MSTAVMAACWPLQMPPTPKAVLMSLADNANDHGVCWPSVTTICARTCFGRTAVLDAIAWLEGQGVILADRSMGRSTRYQIVPSADLFPREKPVRLADQSASRTGSAAGRDQSASRTTPVRQADPNRKEPSGTAKKEKAQQSVDVSSWPSQPTPEVLADWIAHRKAKRAPLTDTVIRAFGREIAKVLPHGFDADAVLTKCMNRNWQGFEAEWLLRDLHTARAGPIAAANDSKTLTGMKTLQGMKHGLVRERNPGRPDEAHVALAGPDAGRRLGTDHRGDVD